MRNEPGVDATGSQQLSMGTRLDYPSGIHDKNRVGVLDSGQAMRALSS